jgi:hypothetical protein
VPRATTLAQRNELEAQSLESIPLRKVFSPWLCGRFPPKQSIPTTSLPVDRASMRVLESGDVDHFRVRSRTWVRYEELQEGFERSPTTSNISRIPMEVLSRPVKLIVRDEAPRLRAALTGELVYPKRAWVGVLLPEWTLLMGYAVVGILNSAVGEVMYQRLARERRKSGRDIRESLLGELPIPLPTPEDQKLPQVALLAYRLHLLYEAEAACGLHLDSTINSHWSYLLTAVVDLYGWPEGEARRAFEELGAHRDDLPGDQGQFLLERPELRSPMLRLKLLNETDLIRYDSLKLRARSLNTDERDELESLRGRLLWEDRINSPIPASLAVSDWPGIAGEREALRAALRFLSLRKGQAFGAERAQRISPEMWQVDFYYSPPAGLKPEHVSRIPHEWIAPGKHPAGTLYINAKTGEVRESLDEAQRAAAC